MMYPLNSSYTPPSGKINPADYALAMIQIKKKHFSDFKSNTLASLQKHKPMCENYHWLLARICCITTCPISICLYYHYFQAQQTALASIKENSCSDAELDALIQLEIFLNAKSSVPDNVLSPFFSTQTKNTKLSETDTVILAISNTLKNGEVVKCRSVLESIISTLKTCEGSELTEPFQQAMLR